MEHLWNLSCTIQDSLVHPSIFVSLGWAGCDEWGDAADILEVLMCCSATSLLFFFLCSLASSLLLTRNPLQHTLYALSSMSDGGTPSSHLNRRTAFLIRADRRNYADSRACFEDLYSRVVTECHTHDIPVDRHRAEHFTHELKTQIHSVFHEDPQPVVFVGVRPFADDDPSV
jgi:hypothetical protein